jgi:hypothetical protein
MTSMNGRAAILEKVINRKRDDMPEQVARYVLTLDFPPSIHKRYAKLATKVQDGKLTQREREELEDLLLINAFLTIIQAKARVSLKKKKQSTAA